MLDLAIVIVNYRSWPKLEGCLSSLDHQTRKGREGNCGRQSLRRWSARKFYGKIPLGEWIKNDTNAGFAAACNLGAQNISNRWLLFLNPDTRLPNLFADFDPLL